MNDKVCKNCKWFVDRISDKYEDEGYCCRYPKWMLVDAIHYCGEWKDGNDD